MLTYSIPLHRVYHGAAADPTMILTIIMIQQRPCVVQRAVMTFNALSIESKDVDSRCRAQSALFVRWE